MILDSQWEVQKAIYDKLSLNSDLTNLLKNGSASILDYIGKDEDYPFITISDSIARPNNTILDNGLNIEINIKIFSNYQGSKELKQIMAEIYQSLEDCDLSLDNHHVILCRFISSEVKQAENLRQANQRFQIITELKI